MGTGDAPDPYAKKLRPDAPDAERPGPTFAGFLDDSGRTDYKRLYLTADGSAYVEFHKDAATFDDIPPDQSPFVGEQATLVRLLPNAPVEYTYRRVVTADEFDLHLRLIAGDQFALLGWWWPSKCCPRDTLNCTDRHTCR
jgi:hypothetical protein